jgi:hypothetical protein
MSLSRERLDAESAGTGFDPATLEKLAFLLAVLEGVNRHPLLKGRLALKGGTALDLFGKDDHKKIELRTPLYDELYAWCRAKVRQPEA